MSFLPHGKGELVMLKIERKGKGFHLLYK